MQLYNFRKNRGLTLASCLFMFGLFWYANFKLEAVSGTIFRSFRLASQVMEQCSCPPESRTNDRPSNIANPESLCQPQVADRGLHQKVVSYCLEGDVTNDKIFAHYFSFINQLAQQVADIYPGWVMRIYHKFNSTDSAFSEHLCQTYCQYAHVDLCNVSDLALKSPTGPVTKDVADVFLMLWRFLPMADPTVDVFLSRDLDSPVIMREGAAVSDWLYRSNATLHVLRDNHGHLKHIMGGMWGARMDLGRRDDLRQVFLDMKHESLSRPKRCGVNQVLLELLHSTIGVPDSIRYETYYCTEFPNITRPFPMRRNKYDFIGSRWYQESKSLKKCPIECRPPQHKDWEHC